MPGDIVTIRELSKLYRQGGSSIGVSQGLVNLTDPYDSPPVQVTAGKTVCVG
jgi:hypothetical protein